MQVLIVFHAVGVNEGLDLRIGVPLLAIDFVSADVKVGVRKQLGHFRDELVQELVSRLLSGIHDRVDAAAPQRVRARPTGKFRISNKP